MIPVKNGSPFDGIRPLLSILFVLIVFILQQGRQALLHTGHDWISLFILQQGRQTAACQDSQPLGRAGESRVEAVARQ